MQGRPLSFGLLAEVGGGSWLGNGLKGAPSPLQKELFLGRIVIGNIGFGMNLDRLDGYVGNVMSLRIP